jgi:alkyl sulfatase BDS1-like metallo-beta-lactamase superfamily hydrolase
MANQDPETKERTVIIVENLYAGNAMVRRKSTYGGALPSNPYGQPEPA